MKISEINPHPNKKSLLTLAIGAMGVVYGDLGTSPIYTMKECFNENSILPPTPENVLGIISLIFWSLMMVVTIKYVTFVMRADNNGEGGIFSLLALLTKNSSKKILITFVALFGAALLYGDGVITPVISVLSALEGLSVATESARPLIIPLTAIVLFSLFSVQKFGTEKIGRFFGPIMLIWFISIAGFGISSIIKMPYILVAINPYYAISFLVINKLKGFLLLGAVVLCITGAEALYADMGHFGKKPIQLAWYYLILPSLLLNYFGQGASLLEHPTLKINPFYAIVPAFLIYPMVILSTIATTIASQSLISGIFSLTRQAIQLGFFPRLQILHTSIHTEGQIYIPIINKIMMIFCITFVFIFKNSSNLAAAFGMAVTANMVLTSIVYFAVLRQIWKWELWKAVLVVSTFLIFDFTYFISNLFKFFEGAYLPLMIALAVFIIMITWKEGKNYIVTIMEKNKVLLNIFFTHLKVSNYYRVSGTAVFMSILSDSVPTSLLNNLKYNHILHEKVILLSIKSLNIPFVKKEEQVIIQSLEHGFYKVIAMYGFMETPNIPNIMNRINELGLKTYSESTSYYLGRESLLTTGKSKLMNWQKTLFSFLSRNAQNPTLYYKIPPTNVVELSTQIEI